MPLMIGDIKLDPAVFLAPMAGITDAPMRAMVSKFGAGLVVSEMVASKELVQANHKSRSRAMLGEGPIPTSVQIAGREAHWMAEAARLLTNQGAKLIDINMGCPAKKVTTGYSGSALMKTPDYALTLIEAVVNATPRPVTLKMRLGWDDDCLNAADIAKRAEAVGIKMITIHGRTRNQFYKGNADWAAVAEVVQAVDIPVIVNGDIVDGASAIAAKVQSGAAGVMIGRGAQGAPWIIAQVAHEVFGTTKPTVPKGDDLVALVAEHYEEMLTFYGKTLGHRVARKHIGWYMDRCGTDAVLRKQVLTATSPKDVMDLLPAAMSARQMPEAAA
ncbi:MAG: tRNA dihydrouridine synthase DusB [Planktomarina sp.]